MSSLSKKTWIVVFVVALALPSVSTYLPLEKVEIENQRLVPPDVTPQSLVDPSFYLEALAYTRDASPVRARLIQASSHLDFTLFGDSPVPNDVLVGNDGWLYGTEAIEEVCEGTAPVTAAAENLIDTAHYLRSLGATVVVTVSPAKFAVHPEALTTSQLQYARCAFDNHSSIRHYLSTNPTEGVVDGWALFESLKETGEGPYFKTDTHFTYEASIPWMRAIVDEIDATVWDDSAIHNEGEVLFIGNLMTLIGLGRPEVIDKVTIDRGVDTAPDEQMHERFSEAQTATEIYRNSGSVIEGQSVMLKDSFMDIPDSSIAQFFGDLTMTDWRSGQSVDYFVERAIAADVVIIETSEEALASRFGDRGLLQQLQAASSD